MGFRTPEEYDRFMSEVTQIEKILVEDGFKIIKFLFSIDNKEQKNAWTAGRPIPCSNGN